MQMQNRTTIRDLRVETMSKTAQTQSLMDLAVPVSQRVGLESIHLKNANVRSNLAGVASPPSAEYSFDATTVADPSAKRVSVVARFRLFAQGKSADSPLLRVDAEFLVEYEIKSLEGITKENLDAFGRMNGIYNVWPYWREYVQSTTVRLGLPPLTMPVLTGETLLAIYRNRTDSSGQEMEETKESPA
jgi:hypothetical protein